LNSRVVAEEDVQEVEQLPVIPEGPLAPSISGVVVDLRDSWLADVEAEPGKYQPKKVAWYVELWLELARPWREAALWRSSRKQAPRPVAAAPTKRRRKAAGSIKRTETTGRVVSAILAFVFAVGLILYVATVMNLLDPFKLAVILKR
jgi:hypothetical protein